MSSAVAATSIGPLQCAHFDAARYRIVATVRRQLAHVDARSYRPPSRSNAWLTARSSSRLVEHANARHESHNATLGSWARSARTVWINPSVILLVTVIAVDGDTIGVFLRRDTGRTRLAATRASALSGIRW